MQPAFATEHHQAEESHGTVSSTEHSAVEEHSTSSTEQGTVSSTEHSSNETHGKPSDTEHGSVTMTTEHSAEETHNASNTEHGTPEEHGGAEEHHEASSSYHPPSHYNLQIGPAKVHLDTLMGSWLVMAILIALAFMGTRKLSKKPEKKQVFFESVVDLANSIVSSQVHKDTYRYVPLIGTIFLFVLCSNWLGLLPWRVLELFGTPHGFEIASPTNDVNTNGAIAVISVISYWYFGIRKKGLAHFKHYFQPMWFLFPLNMMEDLTRPLSLTFRLFGNIIGGEIVMGILLFLTAPLIVTSVVVLPMMTLEVLVGFIQAFIFSMLTASYIGAVVAEHH
ncbi:ATP synthase F0 subunit A [bacterium (Candidatus Blackallbacteria) CG17_big_fil_post_rev_8_21_14_2_50_48_46]|uniref:ATP synthase subunit a n=1 Tax=bacterium (Candidatus Blackallbacteria) CG17_big_fil_post_rev_8_21_14_2_50_48_46 TaxID=2014261 RepID=A0A2M7FYI7_9BACT|nr:MAG: ATP synthase F0 subunit A [bacterium (Candidatus Blackallbacteria) CG18_big_fil_WC_8_21_14_2_50_49_26]PIW14412.1 MAG: ATP synthase F0 subunit A [bacterium (Candidatus Blackallbacteria) CG17_big_fil_post_rev_8_21_14_2_50_48_46]PIW46919.1 MAG: ATP synthase F0 subunit A [bacterium (Candidatus Blackallbacteria) CG13_big_fil_rev_8_21_14_2_50_49_14]